MVTAKDLQALRQRRASINHETYKAIYAEVQGAVKRACETDPTTTATSIFVPGWMPKRPPFNHQHAVNYVVACLERRGGFRVTRGDDPGVLHVSWAKVKKTGDVVEARPIEKGFTKKPIVPPRASFSTTSPAVAKAFRAIQDINHNLRIK